jgi:hypothetical protein
MAAEGESGEEGADAAARVGWGWTFGNVYSIDAEVCFIL